MIIYDNIRTHIKSGDIVAWSHTGLSSKYDFEMFLVRLFTRSEYVHVGVVWKIAGRIFVLESTTSGIRIFPLSKLTPFYLLNNKYKWNKTIEEYALSKLGQEYSKFEAIKGFLDLVKPGEDNKWQCAEYTLWLLEKMSNKKIDIKSTPSAIVEFLLGEGSNIIFVQGENNG